MTSLTTDLLSTPERGLVLHAMADLCSERGYTETSIEEIVERSGVSAESFAEMFAGKEQCAIATVNAILAAVMAEVSSSYSPDLAERDSYLVAIRAILELLATQPAFAYVSFIGARQMAPSQVGQGLEAGARMLSALLERLRSDSGRETPAVPQQAARAALGGAEAVVRREIVAGRTAQLPRLLPDFVYAATVPFLGAEEALRLARRGRELLKGTAWE